MLILGAQVLLGFQLRSPFESGFTSLPASSQYLTMSGLVILLIAIALIMSPGPYHRIVWQGNDSPDVHDFTTRVMTSRCFPFWLRSASLFMWQLANSWGRQVALLSAQSLQ
jgi:Family of unknown function (DUF6328)